MNRLKLSLIWLVSCLAVTGAFAAESTAAPAKAPTPTPESFQVRNVKFGDLLRPEEANSADGTRIVLYAAQPWKCMTWKMHPAGESNFNLQNHFTGKTLAPSAKADGVVIQVEFAKDAKERPAWRLTKLPDGLYQIIEVKSGMALTATSADGGVTLVPVAKGDEQKWAVEKIDPSKLTM